MKGLALLPESAARDVALNAYTPILRIGLQAVMIR
jgi:hypothetical protein